MPRKPRPTLDSATNLKVWLAWVCGEHVITSRPITSAKQLFGIAMAGALAEHGNIDRVIPLQHKLHEVAVHLYDAMQSVRSETLNDVRDAA